MSRTVPVIAGGAMFWAYDVAFGVLCVEASRVCAEMPGDLHSSSRPELLRELRAQALIGGSAALVLDGFDPEQRQALLDCVMEAARRIEARGGVSRDEVANWPELQEDASAFLRGAEHVAAGPLVELAQALVDLAAGTLAPAPVGRHWFFGTPEGRIVQGG